MQQNEREYIICRSDGRRTRWLNQNPLTFVWSWKSSRGAATIISASDLDATLAAHCAGFTCDVLTYRAPAARIG